MAIKVELFGIIKEQNEDSISVFFKTPKRFIYQLMFKKHYEYVSVQRSVDLSKYTQFKKIGDTYFCSDYMKDTGKYKINVFQYSISKYPCKNFEEFFKFYIEDQQIQMDLYEFLFSDIYKYLINENNLIIYNRGTSSLPKKLYKYLQTYGVTK